MKVWKSPVFYFGIFLVLAVAGLLAAPYVIDWNSYRAEIEDSGQRLSGRRVTVDGNISARLFPWPRLTIEKLRIANPPGMGDGAFMTAERAIVRMSLAGLLGGRIEVESVEIERPVVALERRDGGLANWVFAPSEEVAESDVLGRIRLDRIVVTDGRLQFVDRRRGGPLVLEDVNAVLSAPGIAGPWRVRPLEGRTGLASYKGRKLDASITTGVVLAQEPLRIGLRVSPADGGGPVLSFDGELADGKAVGEVRVAPGATPEGKSDSEGQLRPLVVTTQVAADFDGATFDRIEIAPTQVDEGGIMVTGAGRVDLGEQVRASADLKAMSLDLDHLLGAEARTRLREGGILSLAGALLAFIPEDVSLAGAVHVTSLTFGGERLDNAALVIDADRNAIRLKELSTSLPGRSRVLYEGVFFPGKAGAEVAGSLALESSDLRQLVTWLWPEGRAATERIWAGSRGRFKLETELAMTPARLRLAKAAYELDGQRGTGDFTLTAGGRTALDLRLDAGKLDLDNLLGSGVADLTAGATTLPALIGLFVPHGDAADTKVTFRAGELQLNNVTARDVVLDFAAGVTGFDLRSLQIGSVGGASVRATGLILGSPEGPDGSIGVDVLAEDPGELLRLAGLVRGDVSPAWAVGLGKTVLEGNVIVQPEAGQTKTSFDVNGAVGDISLSVNGLMRQAASLDASAFSGALEIATPTSRRMLALFGIQSAQPDNLPAKLGAAFDGSLVDGFSTDLRVSLLGGNHGYAGQLRPFVPGLGLDGKLALRATDVAEIATALGLPAASLPTGVFVADAALKAEGDRLAVSAITGRLGDASFSGDMTVSPGRVVKAEFNTGPLALKDVLAAALLDWRGAAPGREAPFSAGLPLGVTGELWLSPSRLDVNDHLRAEGALLGLAATAQDTRLTLRSKDAEGRDTQFEILAEGDSGARRISGSLSVPVELAAQLALAGGGPVASGEGRIDLGFAGEGRSPAGVLASLSGKGDYRFDDLRILGLDPKAFLAAVDGAKDGAGLTAAFETLRRGGDLAFGAVSGAISVAAGEVRLAPFVTAADGAEVQVEVLGELALEALDASVSVRFPGRQGLPGLAIAFAGQPSALVRSEDMAELSTRLGVSIMQQGIDELERLHKEQERLAQEEERLRKEDEERLLAYYAQRDELLLRRREIRIHGQMRAYESERLRLRIEAERAANAEINKDELRQRQRQLRIFRQQAKLERVNIPVPPEKPRATMEPRKPERAKPKTARAAPGPVILVKPEGAPVVISDPPSGSPSQ